MTISAFQSIPPSSNPKEVVSLIHNLIQSHIQNLLVAKDSSQQYLEFLKNFKESPFYLIKNHLETQWEGRIERFEQLLADHESICFLTYKSAALAVQLPLKDAFRGYIQQISRSNCLHKYLSDCFKWFRKVYAHVQLVVQRTGIASARYSEWFPKAWTELLRDDRQIVSTLSQRREMSKEIEESVQGMLDGLRTHIAQHAKESEERRLSAEQKFLKDDEARSSKGRMRVAPKLTPHASSGDERPGNLSRQSSESRLGEEGHDSYATSSSVGLESASVLAQHKPDQSIRFHHPQAQHTFDNMPTSYYFIHDRFEPNRINAFDIAQHEDFALHKTPYIAWSIPDRNMTASEYRYHTHGVRAHERQRHNLHRAPPHHPSEELYIRKYFEVDANNSPNRSGGRSQHHKFGIPKSEQPKWV